MPSYNRITGRNSRNVAGVVGVELNTQAATQKLDYLIAFNFAALADRVAFAAANQFMRLAEMNAPYQETDRINPHTNENEGRLLSESFRIVPIGPANYRIENFAPWAASVEFGADPHPIDAVQKPQLRFFWENEGRWFRGMHVDHPGIGQGHTHPFMAQTAREFAPTYNAMIRQAFREAGL